MLKEIMNSPSVAPIHHGGDRESPVRPAHVFILSASCDPPHRAIARRPDHSGHAGRRGVHAARDMSIPLHFVKQPRSQRYAARPLQVSGVRACPFPFSVSLMTRDMERREAPGTNDAGAQRTMTRSAACLARHAHPNDAGVRRLPALHQGRANGAMVSLALAFPRFVLEFQCRNDIVLDMFFSEYCQVRGRIQSKNRPPLRRLAFGPPRVGHVRITVGPLSNFPRTPAPRSRRACLRVRAARTALWLLRHFGPVACPVQG